MHLTRDDMETRRLSAPKLFRAGARSIPVGELFDVSRNSAGRWEQRVLEEGARGLKKSVAPGRPSRLDDEQRAALKQLCEEGPQAAGYDRDHWTQELLTRMIWKQFRIRYDPDHVGRMLRRMGVDWGPKRRRQKARQANL